MLRLHAAQASETKLKSAAQRRAHGREKEGTRRRGHHGIFRGERSHRSLRGRQTH
jgi:hypothetical protein